MLCSNRMNAADARDCAIAHPQQRFSLGHNRTGYEMHLHIFSVATLLSTSRDNGHTKMLHLKLISLYLPLLFLHVFILSVHGG